MCCRCTTHGKPTSSPRHGATRTSSKYVRLSAPRTSASSCSASWTGVFRCANGARPFASSYPPSHKLDIVSCGKAYKRVQKAICSGFFRNAAKKDPQEGYKTQVDQQAVYVHPSSAVYNRQPEWVIYHELVMTTKEYMRAVTAIDPKARPVASSMWAVNISVIAVATRVCSVVLQGCGPDQDEQAQATRKG